MTTDTLNPDPLLCAREAGRYLGLEGVVKDPGKTVRAMTRRKKLPSVLIAGKVFVRKSWLDEYIQQQTRPMPDRV
jgi:hypothetical protein